jgi:hypothetical protein
MAPLIIISLANVLSGLSGTKRCGLVQKAPRKSTGARP